MHKRHGTKAYRENGGKGVRILNLGSTELGSKSLCTLGREPRYPLDRSLGKKGKVIPLHATEVLGGRGGIAPTHT
jgi:hypothetical protein